MAATTMERGYHNTSSSYVLPNDAIEQDRLDAQADAIVAMIGGAPFLAYNRHLTNASKAVDIGCGTGVATIQLAALLPSANVVGVDITPVPAPALAAASPNLQWETGNILDVDMEKQTDSLSRGALAPNTIGPGVRAHLWAFRRSIWG